MNADDIVFDDVTYREPRKLRRPDRDRRWACLAYEVPGPEDLPIYLDGGTADAIERHALRDTSVELGGILLGRECVDEETGRPFVWVTKALEAKHFENSQASFTYTHDSWEEITRERDRLHPDLNVVGWYHTHPDFGVFLSSHDLFIHHNFFAQPLQVAYVVDPIRQTRGFFQWRDGRMIEVGGFHVTAERGERVSLARQVNELENIPNTEMGLGGLSPRLEAELIAMLSRTSQPVTAAADRTQTAAVFSLLGIVLGVLGFGVLLWLNSLAGQVREQTALLKNLESAQQKGDLRALAAMEDARVSAKEAALDSLLKEVQVGASKERFTELYLQAKRDRDKALQDVAVNEQIRGDLVAKNREIKRLETAAADAQKEAEVLRRRATLAGDLRKNQEDLDEMKAQIAVKREELQDIKDVESGALPRKYKWAWYAAVSGWAVSVLLGLGLVAVLAKNLPNEEADADGSPRAPAPGDRPTS